MGSKGIRLENVSKAYAADPGMQTWALKEISVSFEPGQFIGIAGNNASGKTTLARLLNGLLRPTTGTVLIDGMDTVDHRRAFDIRRRVAMVFQNPDNQIISSVVEEEIGFGPGNLNLPQQEIDRRVEESLDLMELSDLRGHSPHLLSGGQKQRLAIAAALAMHPDYLVLDEPTAMLDQACRRELIDHLHVLNREHGMTIILASHCMEDLAEADRIVVLRLGSVVADAPPWKIFGQEAERTGLKPPDVFMLGRCLRQVGIGIDEKTATITEVADQLCRL